MAERNRDYANRPRRGVVPKFSDLEVIALSATAEARGIDSENLLFKRLEAEKGNLLPNLISRRQYNQRRKLTGKLGEDIRWRHRCCHGRQGGCVRHRLQAGQGVSERPRQAPSVMGRDDFERAPAWGYCASQGMRYYGYKLHAICGISGVIHSFDMTAANVHDLHYLKDVKWEYHDRMILGDKGYLSAAIQPDLFENLVPVRAEPCRPATGPERSRDYVNSPHHPRGSLQAQPEELATAYMG